MRRITPVDFPLQGRPGPQGPQGVPGPIGPRGLTGASGSNVETGFGDVQYTEATVEASDVLEAGVLTRVRFDPATTVVTNSLLSPFTNHVFFSDDILRARSFGDSLWLVLNIIVAAEVVNGVLSFSVDVNSPLGVPIVTANEPLVAAAGVPERVTFVRPVRCREGFVANGATMNLKSSVRAMIARESLTVLPATGVAIP